MFGGGCYQPETVTQRCVMLFGITASSPNTTRLIAGDWIEDEEGSYIDAAAMRLGLTQYKHEYGYGNGDGNGYGNGSGYGYGHGNGDGD